MVYHKWGDDNVDWAAINDAARFIGDFCKRWGLLGGQTKEKYGSVRFFAKFGHLSLHSIIYPRYYYSQFPKWLWYLDVWYIGPVLRFFFETLFVRWQKFIYSRAYHKACQRWPHIQAEILSCCDYPEFIKGRTRIEETETEVRTHILDLQGNIVSTWVSSKPETYEIKENKVDDRTRLERYQSMRKIGCPVVYSFIKSVLKR